MLRWFGMQRQRGTQSNTCFQVFELQVLPANLKKFSVILIVQSMLRIEAQSLNIS